EHALVEEEHRMARDDQRFVVPGVVSGDELTRAEVAAIVVCGGDGGLWLWLWLGFGGVFGRGRLSVRLAACLALTGWFVFSGWLTFGLLFLLFAVVCFLLFTPREREAENSDHCNKQTPSHPLHGFSPL